jgi:CubicO group peptidase (beta-lactamase class C family)
VTSKSPAEVLSERIWSKLGTEKDAFLQVDANGTPLVGLSLNARLRDLARFGEMMRLGGRLQRARDRAEKGDRRAYARREP